MKARLTKRREYRQRRGNKPQADEFFYLDQQTGLKLQGRYDSSGNFIVDKGYRDQCNVDSEGYLLHSNGNRVFNAKIKDRLKKREL